jgi:N-acetylglucosaminyldiphosphoundecaprenol N-acetyl-beta-D-mannosaminyltransferase
MVSTVEIFGVDICSITFNETVETLLRWIEERKTGRFIVTPNLNHLVLYQDDADFRNAYGKASLVVPDGRYVILISRILGRRLPEPVNGSDLVPALMEESKRRGNLTVFLLGAMPGIAEAAAAKVESRWRHVKVVGTYSPPVGFETDPLENQSIIERINKVSPDLLIVGVTPPRQEIWLSRHAAQIRASASICAGATIDFLAESKPRAPVWMQKCGMEWIFRALSEPRRLIPRYLNDGIAVLKLFYREVKSGQNR